MTGIGMTPDQLKVASRELRVLWTNYDPAAERKKAGNKEPITFGEFMIFKCTPFAIRDCQKSFI